MPRNEIDAETQYRCWDRIKVKLDKRFREKGTKSLTSIHEAMGIIDEEVHEMHDEVRANNYEKFDEECLDIIISCMMAIMSNDVKGFDW